MRRAELTDEAARRILIGAVRNNVTASTIFQPWYSLDLQFMHGVLHRTDTYAAHDNRPMTPLLTAEEAHTLSDAEIWQRVTGEPM